MLYADYSLPIEAARQQLQIILQRSLYWDGKVNVLHISDATPQVIELRILASASNASKAWDLRCEIREKMICFIQQEYPQCLPKIRTETTFNRN